MGKGLGAIERRFSCFHEAIGTMSALERAGCREEAAAALSVGQAQPDNRINFVYPLVRLSSLTIVFTSSG